MSRKTDRYFVHDFNYVCGLGKGGFGRVVLVKPWVLALPGKDVTKLPFRMMALKQVSKSKVSMWKKELVQESKILQEMRGDPFIIQLICAFQSHSHLYFVTDFYEGGTLFHFVHTTVKTKRKGELLLDFKHFTILAAELSLAVGFLHEKGIVHRDLKPPNIMLNEKGHVVIIDLGLACFIEDITKPDGRIIGTKDFNAPEALEYGRRSKMVDWWGVGITLLVTLTGYNPFHPPGERTDKDMFLRKTAMESFNIDDHVPEGFSEYASDFLQSLLKVDPEQRLGAANGKDEVTGHLLFTATSFRSPFDWFQLKMQQSEPPIPPSTYRFSMSRTAFEIQLEQDRDHPCEEIVKGRPCENHFEGFSASQCPQFPGHTTSYVRAKQDS